LAPLSWRPNSVNVLSMLDDCDGLADEGIIRRTNRVASVTKFAYTGR